MLIIPGTPRKPDCPGHTCTSCAVVWYHRPEETCVSHIIVPTRYDGEKDTDAWKICDDCTVQMKRMENLEANNNGTLTAKERIAQALQHDEMLAEAIKGMNEEDAIEYLTEVILDTKRKIERFKILEMSAHKIKTRKQMEEIQNHTPEEIAEFKRLAAGRKPKKEKAPKVSKSDQRRNELISRGLKPNEADAVIGMVKLGVDLDAAIALVAPSAQVAVATTAQPAKVAEAPKESPKVATTQQIVPKIDVSSLLAKVRKQL